MFDNWRKTRKIELHDSLVVHVAPMNTVHTWISYFVIAMMNNGVLSREKVDTEQ